jgi:hypothetical protein
MSPANPEGTMRFIAKHPHPDWFSNSDTYIFPRLHGGGLTVASSKQPDRTFVVTVTGLPNGVITFNHPVPPIVGAGELVVLIVWTPKSITLYFNGKKVD